MISEDLSSFLESPVSILVGSRDEALFPEGARAVGARVEAGGEELTVYLPVATTATTLANLEGNGRIAVCFTRPMDHRSVQLKGRVLDIRPAGDDERERVNVYRAGIAKVFGELGLPPRLTFRVTHWPCHAVRLKVESLFIQTPGPGAGEPMRAGG